VPGEVRIEVDKQDVARLLGPAVKGAILGSLLGAALGLVVSLVLGVEPQPLGPLIATIGMAGFFGFAGFFYGGARRLPVTEGALEAPVASEEPVEVVLEVDDNEVDRARRLLESAGAEVRVQSS
jgi:hypothetical protein